MIDYTASILGVWSSNLENNQNNVAIRPRRDLEKVCRCRSKSEVRENTNITNLYGRRFETQYFNTKQDIKAENIGA